MKQVLFLISNFIILSVFAQRSYYFNNKNIIGYSSNFIHLDIFDFKQNQHHFTYQRMLNRKQTLLLDYGFSKTKLRFNLDNQPRFALNTIDTSGVIHQYNLTPIGEAFIRTKFFSLGMRNYLMSKGSIAPYGPFIDIRAGFSRITQKMADDQLIYHIDTNIFSTNKLPNYGLNHLDIISFQFGFGATKSIVKNFYFDWLLSFKLNATLWQGDKEVNATYYRDLYYYRAARTGYLYNNTIGLNLGIHYGF